MIPAVLTGQVSYIRGQVIDSKDGKPIPHASVTARGNRAGVMTADDGSFALKVSGQSEFLMISSVGYRPMEVRIQHQPINVLMTPAGMDLDESVVVAYGSRRKSDLTGSVTSVSEKDFQKGNIQSAEQLLQGKVAGMQISTAGGAAGAGSSIRIRGAASLNASNEPLIVIDGMPVETNTIPGTPNFLNTINPGDIQSITVLKDASATALYGSRGSNGVLIITTKSGSNDKLKFNYNTQISLSTVTRQLDLLSPSDISSIVKKDALATADPKYQNLLGTASTDWQNQLYRLAPGATNNLSLSGHLKSIPFRLSFGHTNQGGILRTNYFNRVSSALNLSPELFHRHLSVKVDVKAASTRNRFADDGAVSSAVSFDPTQAVRAQNNYGGYFEWLQNDGEPIDLATRNPLGLLNQRDNTSSVKRIIGTVLMDYKLHFFPDLHVMVNAGLDHAHGIGHDNIDSLSATNYKTGGKKVYYQQKKTNSLLDVYLSYSRTMNKINTKLDVLAGHSYQDFTTNAYYYPSLSYRRYADPGKPLRGDTIAGTQPAFPTDKPEYRLESYFARTNIAIADKYLITATLRRDASSKFSRENRVGYFPAFAFAWKLKNELFQTSRVINDLKLRMGWGMTGQQDFGNLYPYLPRYQQSTNTAEYQFGSMFYSFLRPGAYDPHIKWETTTTTNAGVDFALFENHISGSLDVYQRKTRDLLSVIPVAPGANFDISLLTNVGSIENKGVELSLNALPIQSGAWTWSLGVNLAYNHSVITRLLKQPDAGFNGIDVNPVSGGVSNYIGKYDVGHSPNVFYVYKQIYDPKTKSPIDGMFEDLNQDGTIDDADRYFYQKPAPDFLIGFHNELSYKNWSLGLAAHGALGNYMYNQFDANNGNLKTIKNPLGFIENGSRSYLKTGFTGNNVNEFLSDYYIENASFFRIDNINIGWKIGKIFNGKASLRLTGTVQNAFIFTGYKGLDPEAVSDVGVSFTIYPRPRIFSLGGSLDF